MSGRRQRRRRAELFLAVLPLWAWPEPYMNGIGPESCSIYAARQFVIELYWAKRSTREILYSTGIPLDMVRRLALNALKFNPEARQIVGFWACSDGYREAARQHQRHRSIQAMDRRLAS